MSALTNDRPLTEIAGVAPSGFAFGTPSNGITTYFGQLLAKGADQLLRPALTSTTMSGSVCVGVSMHSNFAVSAATPLPEQVLSYKIGCFSFQNDTGNPVTAGTLPGTLLFAADDQTVSLSSSGGTRAVAGRLNSFFTSGNYPVFVDVGPMSSVSGSTF